MVRVANFDDFRQILDMAEDFSEAAGLPYEEGSTANFLSANVAAWDKLFLVAPKNESELKGMLIGMLVPWVTDSNCLISVELAWWVKPEYRKTGTAIELLQGYITWAKEAGAKRIQMSSLNALEGDRVGRIYERLGFKFFEREYVMEI
jgi:GNAT superfamily N-acetyltransferase